MLNETDRARIAQLTAKDPEAAYVIRLLEEDRREMLSLISHEIRNPLTLINSSLQIIEKSHPEASGFRFWPQVKEDIRSLRLLLDDLSVYNNASALHRETVDLCTLVRDVTDSFLPELTVQEISLELPPKESLPASARISGDPLKLRQVIVNLMKNAMEALDGVDAACIRISLSAGPGQIRLDIANNGPAIPLELQEEIFLPFRTYKPQGTGLGLPLCRRIIEAHGGTLTLRSSSQATVFTIFLPCSDT